MKIKPANPNGSILREEKGVPLTISPTSTSFQRAPISGSTATLGPW